MVEAYIKKYSSHLEDTFSSDEKLLLGHQDKHILQLNMYNSCYTVKELTLVQLKGFEKENVEKKF